jgi:ribosomal-protein-alanine N-acetyltransferase
MAALERRTEASGQPRAEWRAALPTLANDRVVLRELRLSDAAVLYRVACCPEVARYTWPAPPAVEAFERFIASTWDERAAGKYVGFAIVPRGGAEASGLFELRQMQPGFFRAELGFFIDPSAWGSGLFSEAARLMLDFAFRVVGVHRIEARATTDNLRSNAALRRLGARKEGTLRAAFVRDGVFVDQHLWAMVKGFDTLAVRAPAMAVHGPTRGARGE